MYIFVVLLHNLSQCNNITFSPIHYGRGPEVTLGPLPEWMGLLMLDPVFAACRLPGYQDGSWCTKTNSPTFCFCELWCDNKSEPESDLNQNVSARLAPSRWRRHSEQFAILGISTASLIGQHVCCLRHWTNISASVHNRMPVIYGEVICFRTCVWSLV